MNTISQSSKAREDIESQFYLLCWFLPHNIYIIFAAENRLLKKAHALYEVSVMAKLLFNGSSVNNAIL